MYETGCSGLVHWDDPEGSDGERGGREVQNGEHMYTHGWFLWMYDKKHHNIVISLQLNYNYFVVVFPYINMDPPQMYMCSLSWTPLPPSSPSHPSGSSQCTSPEHPVSCIELGLAIYFTYDNIHVSMLFSQIIPPSLSPTESKSLFFTFVSLLLSHK